VSAKAGLQGIGRGKKDRTTIRNEKVRPAADLVERDFSAPGPESTVGSGDYLHPDWLRIPPSGRGARCLQSPRGGLTQPRTQWVLDALEMVLWQKHPRSVIQPSDQGTQNTSFAFDQRCRRAGIRPSMGSVGDGFDKARCGSFYASQECELLDRNRFPTPTQSRSDLFGFIEGFYNPHRLHSSLGYHSPVEFERRYATLPTIPN